MQKTLENRSQTGQICVDAIAAITENPKVLVYLSGSIEYSPDFGKGWRAEVTPLLKSLGHDVYDPAEDEKKNLTETEVREFRSWKKDDLPRFRRTVRKIIAYDLDLIEQQCEAVVCYWDQHAGRGAGTQGELTFAHRLGIPVYLICELPFDQVSGWLLGCATEVFTSFDEFREFMVAKPAGEMIRS